jgi:uncharacterized membrane protein YfhO
MQISINVWRALLIVLLFFLPVLTGLISVWRVRVIDLLLLFWIILIVVKDRNNKKLSKVEKSIIIIILLLLIQNKFKKTHKIRGPYEKFNFMKDF